MGENYNLISSGGARDDDTASSGHASIASLKAYNDIVTGFLEGKTQQMNISAHLTAYKPLPALGGGTHHTFNIQSSHIFNIQLSKMEYFFGCIKRKIKS